MSNLLRCLAAVLLASFLVAACASDAPDLPAADEDASVEIDKSFNARVTKIDLREHDYVPKHWPGRWQLQLTVDEYVLEYTNFRVIETIEVTEEELRIIATPAPRGAFNCFGAEGERLTGDGEAGAVYTYTLDDDELKLAAKEEPCELRRALIERTWTVAKS